jgi:photosystem II stability/assembly factor-like uncharacterized protein
MTLLPKGWIKNQYLLILVLFLIGLVLPGAIIAGESSLGPFGGYIQCLASSSDMSILYAGTDGGIYQTEDGGNNWTRTNFPNIPVRSLAVAPPGVCRQIDFDDIPAPCAFSETTALRNEYQTQGVLFAGPNGNDGGAVLDRCSGYSPSGQSLPNYLAFDTGKTLADGGAPHWPEHLYFDPHADYVEIKAAWTHGRVEMTAFDAMGNVVDTDSVVPYGTFRLLQVEAGQIAKVTLQSSLAAILLLDDLSFRVSTDPTRPLAVYAGTDNGIYKSDDAGDRWRCVGLAEYPIQSMAVDPYCPEIVYAGTGVEDLKPDGIYKSFDGGETWELVYRKDLDVIRSILIDPNDSKTVYAIGHGVDGSPNFNGFVKSSDGGQTWEGRHLSPLGPWDDVYALASTAAGIEPQFLYAIVDENLVADVYRSDDRGDTWTELNVPDMNPYPPFVLAVLPGSTQMIYISGIENAQTFGMYFVIDGHFYGYAQGLPPLRPSCLLTGPADGYELYLGFSAHGVYHSAGLPPTWHPAMGGMNNTDIHDLAIHPLSDRHVFAAIRGNSETDGYGVARTVDGGRHWDYGVVPPADLRSVTVVSTSESTTLYAGRRRHRGSFFYLYKSPDAGETWERFRFLEVFPYSMVGVSEIWVHPDDPDRILLAVEDFETGGVYLSTNGGHSWTKTFHTWTSTIAADPRRLDTLYLGTARAGYVFRSINCGDSWYRISPPGSWVESVNEIEVDRDGSVYAATDRGLMKWTGSGDVWQKLGGLPDVSIAALAMDLSEASASMYAGTVENGVWISRNGGQSWKNLMENPECPTVQTMALGNQRPKTLYIGTAYNGVWKLCCPGDFDGDGDVDGSDLAGFASDFGRVDCDGTCPGDFDDDGDVDGSDLAVFAKDFGQIDCP